MEIDQIISSMNRAQAQDYIRSFRHTTYLGNGKLLCHILGGIKFFAFSNDIGFSTHLISDGFWEYWLTKHFVNTLHKGDVVLDVGANLGYYTVLSGALVGPTGRVVAVEPNPSIFQLLKNTVSVNSFAPICELLNIALSDARDAREVEFFVPKGEPKNGRFVFPGENTDHLSGLGSVFKVNTRPIEVDDFEKLDFIKIDVEGAELLVLDGLKPLIKKFNPKIVCEVNFSRGYTYDDIVARIGCNESLYHLNFNSEIVPLTEEMAATERLNDDWLVCYGY